MEQDEGRRKGRVVAMQAEEKEGERGREEAGASPAPLQLGQILLGYLKVRR